jgi:hypothetical protein
MSFWIVPIVEGQGEVQAVPVLFRRIIIELNLGIPIDVAQPVRLVRDKLVKDDELHRALRLAARRVGKDGAIFILLDSEGDCPAAAAPELLKRAKEARSDQLISVVLANKEFEAWFLASAASLKGFRGLSYETESHQAPETVPGCKQWLSGRMPATQPYSPTADQAAFAGTFDMSLARKNAPSFDKLYREFERICREAT